MPFFRTLPANDYYAVIFSSTRSDNSDGYEEMDALTLDLAKGQEGFIGYESLNSGNKGIFISYWTDMGSIEKWRDDATHRMAKSKAGQWYQRYLSQICKVERTHLYEK
jgi:heme-degrading monooxygenase HmoA